jgi:hypothetical protein
MKRKVKPGERQGHWLSHIEQAQAMKVSLAQYCRVRGLNVQSLYNARHELSGNAKAGVASSLPGKTAAKRFVAVDLTALPAALTPSTVCRIQLGDVVIECASLPCVQWLSALARGVGHAVP